MIITHEEEKVQTVKYLIKDKIVCNKCGREFVYDYYDNGHRVLNDYIENAQMEFHNFSDTGGYYSKIGDMTSYSFDICDDCLIELMTTFKIAPSFKDNAEYCFDENYDCQKFYEEWLNKKRDEIANKGVDEHNE